MLLQKRMEGFGDKTKIGLLREKPEKSVFAKPFGLALQSKDLGFVVRLGFKSLFSRL